MIQSLEINVAALELLPETDPIGVSAVALQCRNTRVFVCGNKTCDFTCGVVTIG
ncbi:MAG: hypothetical protein ACRD0K_03615 [Egibacteraceae bacterium]